ncbi:unnamed protein product [Parajaminaea phylloscopi]
MNDIDRQEAFLLEESISSDTVKTLLRPLLPETHHDSALAAQMKLWLSVAAVRVLTEPELARRIASVEAAIDLVEVGIAASLPVRDSQDGAASIRGALLTMHSSLQAWVKTAVRTHAGNEDDQVGPSDDGQASDEEDSAWFDTQAHTPSPGPGKDAPSIALDKLLRVLGQPLETALLLCPWPERLSVWLRSVSPAVYASLLKPHRRRIVEASLTFAAIADLDTLDNLTDLRKSDLLPLANGATLWEQLDQGARSLASTDDELSALLSGHCDVVARTQSDGFPTAAAEIRDWFASQALRIESQTGNVVAALRLCALAPEDLSGGEAARDDLLLRVSQDLELCRQFKRPLRGQTGDLQASFPQMLLDEPVQVLHEFLTSSKHTPDEDALRLALDHLTSSADHMHDPREVARQVCWRLSTQDGDGSSRASINVEGILLLLKGSGASQRERQMVALSIFACSQTVAQAKCCAALLNTVFDRAETRREAADPGHEGSRLIFRTPSSPPNPEVFFARLAATDLPGASLEDLKQRCQGWLAAASDPALQLVFSQPELLPRHCLAFAGDALSQQEAFQQAVHGAAKQALSADEWVDLGEASSRLLFAQQPLDALEETDVFRIVLSGAMRSHNLQDGDLQRLVRQLGARLGPDADTYALLVASVRDCFDRAPGGRAAVSELRKVRAVLLASDALPSSGEAASPTVATLSCDFLAAVVRLMQLSPPLPSTMHPSIPMTPAEIRLTKNKLDVVRRWLSLGSDKAWKREQDVLDTSLGLCLGAGPGSIGDGTENQGGADSQPTASASSSRRAASPHTSKHAIKVHVMAMLADAAVAGSDLVQTSHYVDELLSALTDLRKRSRRKSSQVGEAEVEAATEAAWTSLFAISKHPNCQDSDVRKQWLGQAMALAPPARLNDMLKRWRELASSDTAADEEGEAEMAVAVTLAMNTHQQRRGAGGVGSKMPSAYAAAQAASGLGAGVFSLAAAAVNNSHWPLGRSHGGRDEGGDALQPPAAGMGLGGSGVGGALSTLAGHLGEGYGSKLTSLWGGASPLLSSVRPLSTESPTTQQSSETAPRQPARPSSSSSRTAASLFDGFGSGSSVRSESPSRNAAYLDPAERAARAARGFLSGLRTGGGAGNETQSADGGASPSLPLGGSAGWSALSTRGMGWLMGEDEQSGGQSRPQR